MKALVGTFNQEKALVGAFFVIVKTDCETDGSFYSNNFVAGIYERSIIFVTKQICVPLFHPFKAHTGILKYANFLFEFPIWIFYEVQILLLCE